MFWNGFFEGAYPGKVASKVYEIKEVSPNLLCSLSLGADSQCKKYQITQKISIQLILPPDEVIRNVESGSVAVEQRVRCEQWVRCKQWVRCALIHLLLEGIIKKKKEKKHKIWIYRRRDWHSSREGAVTVSSARLSTSALVAVLACTFRTSPCQELHQLKCIRVIC